MIHESHKYGALTELLRRELIKRIGTWRSRSSIHPPLI